MGCWLCGATDKETRIINSPKYGVVCDKCYQRERRSTVTYPLPEYGEVGYSPEGKPICHICGKAYDKLMIHVYQIHGMSHDEYKKEFGLDLGKGLMSEESKELARKRVFENYDVSIAENLLERGKATRFEEGHKLARTYISEQTRNSLIDNISKLHRKGIDNGDD